MTNETSQGLERLSWLPDRDDADNGVYIAGQKYYDVEFTGGTITGITPSSLPIPLAISDGGTGQITANSALNALLPSQVGNSGKTLKTDGTNTSWSTDIDTGITQLTGDVTAGPGSGSQAATLATVNSNVGSFGSSTSIPSFTVNAKGLITAASGNVVIAPAGTLSGSTLAAGVTASSLTSVGTLANLTVTNPISGSITGGAATLTTGRTISITGDITYTSPSFNGSANVTAAGTLATVNSNVGTFASVTVNAKGLVTAAANLTGDITSSSGATTLATVNSNVGSFTNASITVNAKGLITAASSGTTPIMTALGVGSIIIANNGSGGVVSANSTTAASNLTVYGFSSATGGTTYTTGDSLSGTWKALQTLANSNGSAASAGLWQRTV